MAVLHRLPDAVPIYLLEGDLKRIPDESSRARARRAAAAVEVQAGAQLKNNLMLLALKVFSRIR